MKITKKYVFFWKEDLSQWHMHNMLDPISGLVFSCSEQYMMWHKAMLFGDNESADRIMKASHPRDQQAIGRTVKGYNQEKWDDNKYSIVYNASWLKFTSDPRLLARLLNFDKSLTFVEASPMDKIWGIGMDEMHPSVDDETKWLGQNLLGKAITDVRDRILSQLDFSNNYYSNDLIK